MLEIKGGRVSCQDGIWTFTNRFGVEHCRSEGPFDQVRSGMYALKEMLEKEFGHGALRNVCFGWGVVFPDFKSRIDSIEIPMETVLDGPEFSELPTLCPYLDRLATYWRSKPNKTPVHIEPRDISKFASFLRPSFEMIPSLSIAVDRLVSGQVKMTEEQYQYMDCVADAQRIICQGSAGTGKSFIALEVARREARSGKSVVVVCRGEVFAGFLRNRLKGETVDVLHFDASLEHVKKKKKRYDVLIVDEGQDLLELEAIDILGSMVKGGFEAGTWRFFMDSNNQCGLYGQPQSEAMEYLKSCGITPLRLRRNCRNTEQIVMQTQAMTGADIGTAIIEGKGHKVDYFYAENDFDAARQLSRQLTEWVDDGAALGEVVILTPLAENSPTLLHLKEHWRAALIKVTGENAGSLPTNRLPFCSIVDFKGLESRYVAVVDLGGIDKSRKSLAGLYVAMTRANAVLWLAIPADRRAVVDEIRGENVMKLCVQGV